MIKSYFLTALRNLRRSKLHTFINITGLTIGITCCLLIALYVQFELGYDRQNKNADRIYRAVTDLEANNWAISAFPLGALLKENFPEVENYTRIKPVEVFLQHPSTAVKHKEKIFYADAAVFDVLDITLVSGAPATALSEINTMVITEERARIYFGDEDPVGKTLVMPHNNATFKITGVFKPLPANTHVHMQIMISSESFAPMRTDNTRGWNYLTNHYTYLVLPAGIDHAGFGNRLSAFLDQYHNVGEDQAKNVIRLQPLTSIHLHSDRGLEIEANGNMHTIYVLSVIAFFILVIACINFMNLTTAQSLKRAREVGIRKVMGSRKTQLVMQFLSESIVTSFIAVLLAIVLLTLVGPGFNEFSGKDVILNPFESGATAVVLLAATVFVGLCAGTYPAFFLSGFKPVAVLKGNFTGSLGGQFLRKGLVVFQFAVAFAIMVATCVVYSQLRYMLHKDVGFDRDQVLVISMPNDSIGDVRIKNEMMRLAGVRSVTRFAETPGNMVRTSEVWYEDIPENKNAVNVYLFSGDPDLMETLGLTLIKGAFLTEEGERYKEFVINETAARHFGWTPDEAVGKLMKLAGRADEQPGRVVGVIEDFHFKHFHEKIDPLVVYNESHYEGRLMALKLEAGNLQDATAAVEDRWKELVPQHEFEYRFLDESFNRLFDNEKRLGQLFGLFSGLAILISCLGLFGLASFILEQNRKSVAVRKVLGATAANIVFMMSKDFLKLVLAGMLVAGPVVYFLMKEWLQGFAYNVGFEWILFLYAAAAAMLVALGTVSYHSLKAATSNPVHSLKDQ